MIVRKDVPMFYEIKMTQSYQVDARNLRSASWKDVIYSILANTRSAMTLSDIYSMVEGTRKAAENQHWQAKVRQTLQMHPNLFRNVQRGVWSLAAA